MMAEERVMQNDIPAHPAAALFPMLPDDELRELADDIKRNGQQMPILVKDGEIIDGRNRYAACLLAEVDPIIEEFTGPDVKAFIVSANINRRHMTKAARTMAVAMMYPEATAYKRGGANSLETKELNEGVLSQCRTILRESKALAEQVLFGTVPLAEAYEKARIDAAAKQSAEKRLADLEKKYPDLALAVREERLTIPGAEAEARELDKREADRISGLNDSLNVLNSALRRINSDNAIQDLSGFIKNQSDKVKTHTFDGGKEAAKMVASLAQWVDQLKRKL
jgi:hypothetical protein